MTENWRCRCPYVTSVGATALYAGQTILNAESVANVNLRDFLYSSGGGFSNVFPRPSYQDRAVQGYFATAVPNYAYYNGPPAGDLNTSTTNGICELEHIVGMFAVADRTDNRLGRGYPDVSANGAFMPAFVGGLYSHEYVSTCCYDLADPSLFLLIGLEHHFRHQSSHPSSHWYVLTRLSSQGVVSRSLPY